MGFVSTAGSTLLSASSGVKRVDRGYHRAVRILWDLLEWPGGLLAWGWAQLVFATVRVRVDAGFPGQLAAKVGAHFVDALAEHVAVGPREIDVFEDAMRQRRCRKRLDRSQSVRTDDQHFSRLDFANVCRTNQVETAGLRGHGPAVAELHGN